MNIDDIKVGETYYVRMKVTHKEKDQVCVKNPMISVYGCDYMIISHKYIHEQPKHDPCRLFKKGDIVEMDTHGRDIAASMKKAGVELGKRYTVTEDENNTGYVSFIGDDGIEHHSKFFWLKLVTPVEELELFYLDEITDEDEDEEQYHCFMIKTLKGEDKIRTYYSNKFETIAQTKAAAEAECKRLNEEYRKEHE